MAQDEPTATNIAGWLKQGNDAEIQALIAADAAYFLANGTKVRILEVDGSLGRIQVMNGPHANRSGWLPVNATSQ